MGDRRDRMSPGSGKLYNAAGGVVDVAAILETVYDATGGTLKTSGGSAEASSGVSSLASGHTHTPAANTAAVVTLAAAGAGKVNVIRGIAWGYSSAPTGGNLTIKDGDATVFSVPVTGAGPGFIPVYGAGSINKALVVTLAAGGEDVVGSVNVLEAWVETPDLSGTL